MQKQPDKMGNIIHKPRFRWSLEVLCREDTQKAKSIVIKRIPSGTKNAILRKWMKFILHREARIMSEINKKIPGVTPEILYITEDEFGMEKLSGPDLYECRQKLKGEKTVFDKLQKNLLKLHEAGFSHGEIRLGNIVMDKGDLKFVDLASSVKKENIFFNYFTGLDLLSLSWIKENIFFLVLEQNEIAVKQKSLTTKFFCKKIFPNNIPYR